MGIFSVWITFNTRIIHLQKWNKQNNDDAIKNYAFRMSHMKDRQIIQGISRITFKWFAHRTHDSECDPMGNMKNSGD
jgi:hypothetical protein